ncbi:hypothetical protein R3P38DRAFT_2469727, partial [Favolaschia claudopus]
MSPSPTFCDIALSTTFKGDSEISAISSNCAQRSGINCSENHASGVLGLPADNSTCKTKVQLTIKDSLPFDLVLG